MGQSFQHTQKSLFVGTADAPEQAEVELLRQAPEQRDFLVPGAAFDPGLVHQRLDRRGALILDQQALTIPTGDRLEDWADNPFAARQADCGFLDAITEALARHDIGHVIWQRDPHDDLWGWDALPRWPDGCDLSGLPLIGKSLLLSAA
ncbi:hypothetical protein [Paracoccus sp. (in: a-proteobacteria)]|uniref:hypothetical protein n=1 Tax=Paracoccus sp. TaxID=267 RepID=UPI003A8BDE9E